MAAFALTTVLGISAGMYAQQSRVGNVAANVAANVTNEVLRRTGSANDPLPGAWLSYGRTQGETRYSKLKQIDTTNAKQRPDLDMYVSDREHPSIYGTYLATCVV